MFDTVEKSLVITGSSREFGLVRIAHHWRVADVACRQGENAAPAAVD